MKDRFAGKDASFLLMQHVPAGQELIVGSTMSPGLGPLMMFGLGGIYVEVMKDVAFKIHPLTDYDAGEMVKSIKGYPLLTGFRGAPPVDVSILEETLLRISQLISDFPELESFDINPFIIAAKGDKSNPQPFNYVFPIPQREMDLNPQLVQNDQY